MAGQSGDIRSLEARVAADGNDLQSRFDLAQAYAALDRREQAVEQLIAIIAIRRDWSDEAARAELLEVFRGLGPDDKATLAGRRKLSAAWFS